MITVNLKTGDVGQASDTLRATSATAAASSRHRIALCGGNNDRVVRDYCQMYSPARDEYVYKVGAKPAFSGLLLRLG